MSAIPDGYEREYYELPLEPALQGVLPWSAVATYQIGQQAFYQGSTFRASAVTTGNAPPDTAHWQFVCMGPPFFDITQSYPAGAVIAWRGDLYQAVNSNVGNLPVDGTHWTPLFRRSLIGNTWDNRAGKAIQGGATFGLSLQHQWTRLDLLNLELGNIARRAVNWGQAGATQSDKGWADNIRDLRDDAQEQIETLIEQIAGAGVVLVGDTNVSSPQGALSPYRDPNNPALGGDPRYFIGYPWR